MVRVLTEPKIGEPFMNGSGQIPVPDETPEVSNAAMNTKNIGPRAVNISKVSHHHCQASHSDRQIGVPL
jgi:hypothetical protein